MNYQLRRLVVRLSSAPPASRRDKQINETEDGLNATACARRGISSLNNKGVIKRNQQVRLHHYYIWQCLLLSFISRGNYN